MCYSFAHKNAFYAYAKDSSDLTEQLTAKPTALTN